MSLYDLGVDSTPAYQSPIVSATGMIWTGASYGESVRSLYQYGSTDRRDPVVGGIKGWLAEFIVDIAHLALLVGGLMLLIQSIGNL